jgi:hypothetical protein
VSVVAVLVVVVVTTGEEDGLSDELLTACPRLSWSSDAKGMLIVVFSMIGESGSSICSVVLVVP